MPFAFPAVEAETGVPVTERKAGFGEYFFKRHYRGMEYTLGGALSSWARDIFDDSPLLDPKTANKLYMMPAGMEFTEPVRENRARYLQDRYDMLALNQAQLDTYSNIGLARGTVGFAGEVLGGMTSPVDFSLNLIPFVGSTSRAAIAAKLGAGRMTQLATRGLLLSEETIAKHVAYPRVTAAVIDATAGNIVAELGVAVEAIRNKEDYTFGQFSANIAGGALFAAGFHSAGRALGSGLDLAIKQAREIHAKMTPESSSAATRTAVNQTIRGEPVNVTSHVNIDPKVMEAEWRAREAEIRASGEIPASVNSGRTFETAKGSVYQINEDGSTTRNKAPRPEHPGESGIQNPSKQTWYVTADDANKLAEIQAKGGPGKTIKETPDGSGVGVFYLDGPSAGKFEARTLVPASKEPELGLIPVEYFGDNYTVHFGNEIVSMGKMADVASDPRYQAFVKERIDQYVAQKKKEFDENYQRNAVIQKATAEVQSIGPLASPEDMAKMEGARVPEAALADIKEDVRSLNNEFEADLKAIEADDPRLAAELREEFELELKSIDQTDPKAIEAAMRCLINE